MALADKTVHGFSSQVALIQISDAKLLEGLLLPCRPFGGPEAPPVPCYNRFSRWKTRKVVPLHDSDTANIHVFHARRFLFPSSVVLNHFFPRF
jgi:hypothetical protein